MKGQTGLTLLAAALLAFGVGASTIVIVDAAQEASTPPQPANIVDDDDDDDSGTTSSTVSYPLLIDGFEQGLDHYEYYSADPEVTERQSTVTSSDSIEGDKALNLTARIDDTTANFLALKESVEEKRVYKGDVIKFDFKPLSNTRTGISFLTDTSAFNGNPSTGVNYFFQYNEGSSNIFTGLALYNRTENQLQNFSQNTVSASRDQWFTIKAELNTDETGSNTYNSTLYNQQGDKLTEISTQIPEGDYLNEEHRQYNTIKFGVGNETTVYDLIDNIRVTDSDARPVS